MSSWRWPRQPSHKDPVAQEDGVVQEDREDREVQEDEAVLEVAVAMFLVSSTTPPFRKISS